MFHTVLLYNQNQEAEGVLPNINQVKEEPPVTEETLLSDEHVTESTFVAEQTKSEEVPYKLFQANSFEKNVNMNMDVEDTGAPIIPDSLSTMEVENPEMSILPDNTSITHSEDSKTDINELVSHVKEEKPSPIDEMLDFDPKLKTAVVRLSDVAFNNPMSRMLSKGDVVDDYEKFLMVNIKKEAEEPGSTNEENRVTYDLVPNVKDEHKSDTRIQNEIPFPNESSFEVTKGEDIEIKEDNKVLPCLPKRHVYKKSHCTSKKAKTNLLGSNQIDEERELFSKGKVPSRSCKNSYFSICRDDDVFFSQSMDDTEASISEWENNSELGLDEDSASDWEETPRHSMLGLSMQEGKERSSSKSKNTTNYTAESFINNEECEEENQEREEQCEDEESYVCAKCGKSFSSKSCLKCHIQETKCFGNYTPRIKKFQCDECGKCYKSIGLLEDHKNVHANLRPYECNICQKKFTSRTLMMIHTNCVHIRNNNTFICPFCGVKKSSKEQLVCHEQIHKLAEGEEIAKPFKCLKCEKSFTNRFELKTHKYRHNAKFKCWVCMEILPTRYQRDKHLATVHSSLQRQKECKVCHQVFSSNNTLSYHMNMVHTAKKFFCEICEKGFKTKKQIEQHMITHSDARPISCNLCDATFKRKTHLKQHMASAHGK